MTQMTEQQRTRWRELADREEAARPHEEARWNRVFSAARAPGFGGELRSAVLHGGRPWDEPAAAAGVSPETWFAWMSGEEVLNERTIGRIVDALDLHLAGAASRGSS